MASLALLIVCVGSFAWGMQAFFTQPSGYTRGMTGITGAGVLFFVLHFTFILNARNVPVGLRLSADMLYLISLALYWWAIAVNRKAPLSAAFSADEPRHLMRKGPYRIVRHPFYSSYLLTWSAGVLASAQWWLAATVVVMLGIYLKAATMEEHKFLNSSLAGEYAAYKRRVGMLMPNPVKFLTEVFSS